MTDGNRWSGNSSASRRRYTVIRDEYDYPINKTGALRPEPNSSYYSVDHEHGGQNHGQFGLAGRSILVSWRRLQRGLLRECST